MERVIPSIVVTGASGFIGSYFVNAIKDDMKVFAIARRTQMAAGIPSHPNIQWIPADIGDRETVNRVFDAIAEGGGADYVMHLAGYYDFSNEENREYERTNVNGTRFVLEATHKLKPKRFIFASSLTVTDQKKKITVVNEDSPADAPFPYAWSKAQCEDLIRQYAYRFPCTIVRQAAIFSDWCEYGPLYVFLSTWLSDRWDHSILAGRGQAAIPYLHIDDLIHLFCILMRRTDELPPLHMCVGSTDGGTTQKTLFEIAVRYNYFYAARPWYVPKWLASIGVFTRDIWGRILGKRPFERNWMMHYIDRQLLADASRTRKHLSWEPTPRRSIERRLLFLIEKMKSNPYEWHRRNEEVFHRPRERPNLRIYEAMVQMRSSIIHRIMIQMRSEQNAELLPHYQRLPAGELLKRLEHIYQMLENDVRTGDRRFIMNYAHELARARFAEGFAAQEVILAVQLAAHGIVGALLARPRMSQMKQPIHDEIMLTLQLVGDEIEDTFENLAQGNLPETDLVRVPSRNPRGS